MPRQLFVGATAQLGHMAAQLAAVVEQVEDLVGFPAALSDDEQPRRRSAHLVNQSRPDTQQQQVVLARLDGSKRHEGRMRGSLDFRRPRQRIDAEPRGQCRRVRQSLGVGKSGEAVERCPAVRDYAGGSSEDGSHSFSVLVRLSSAAEFRMNDGYEVVYEVHGAYAGPPHPLAKPGLIQTRVADVEIDSAAALAPQMADIAECSCDDAALERLARILEQGEQLLRGFDIEDSAEAGPLDDCLGSWAEMTQIGERDSVDTCRQTAVPAAPDQARDIEQERGIVGQGRASRLQGNAKDAPITTSVRAVNANPNSTAIIRSGPML